MKVVVTVLKCSHLSIAELTVSNKPGLPDCVISM
jgi:hypothetical protein